MSSFKSRLPRLIVGLIAVLLLVTAAPYIIYRMLLPTEFSSCVFTGTARAWEDLNEDGRWDVDEPPLPGVTIRLREGGQVINNLGTMEDGMVTYYWHTVCAKFVFEFEATAPDGFRATTPTSRIIEIDLGSGTPLDGDAFGVGFVRD